MHVITTTRAATSRNAATSSVLSAVPSAMPVRRSARIDSRACAVGSSCARRAASTAVLRSTSAGLTPAREPRDGPKHRGVAPRQLVRARLEHRARAKRKPDDRSPEIERVDAAESLRGDSDDGERHVHDADRLADHIRRSTEVRHPEDCARSRRRAQLDRSTSSGESAAGGQRDAQCPEEVGGRIGD